MVVGGGRRSSGDFVSWMGGLDGKVILFACVCCACVVRVCTCA